MSRSVGTRMRLEQPADQPAVQALVGDAFGGPHVPGLLAAMRQDHCWRGLSFVAEVEERAGAAAVVGHVAFTGGWVDAPDRLVEVLVLSPLAVRPDRQRQGVGTALVEASFTWLRDHRTEPLVFLEGDPRYYSRHGFGPAEARGFSRPSTRIPPAAFQVCDLHPAGDVAGALVYPDVFWRHDAVGLR